MHFIRWLLDGFAYADLFPQRLQRVAAQHAYVVRTISELVQPDAVLADFVFVWYSFSGGA
ncbi:MAG: hypothetical protein A2Z18_11465 [Armatimonadetes bacterium RBG_16_58_9]|nr:MAG: hypothetical protein A2Z18_11465 [Armatimonadetes bacterium RBG_16_58_9]